MSKSEKRAYFRHVFTDNFFLLLLALFVNFIANVQEMAQKNGKSFL